MKKEIILMSAIIVATFSACAQEKHDHGQKETSVAKPSAEQVSAKSDSKSSNSVKEVIGFYLDLKNALVKDNSTEAAAAGVALEDAFKKFDKKNLTEAQIKLYNDVEDDAREHAEHIGANGGDIEHQREHFISLSKDIYDLVKELGSSQVLYNTFCPMANNGKGAMWLSETKTIKNPYFGKKMMTCGSVKEEVK